MTAFGVAIGLVLMIPQRAMAQDCNGNGVPDLLETQTAFTRQTGIDGPLSVFAIDLDGDTDLDVLTASYEDNKVSWYENDGLGNFGPQQVITVSAHGAWAVFAVDLDGDEDADVLSASVGDDTIAWYENTDGLGTFGPQQVITGSAFGARSVFALDLDGDDDADVLSASFDDDTIGWYENTDGSGTFGPRQVITSTALGATAVFARDLDGDGHADVLGASQIDDTIAWYENTNGLGAFGPPQMISNSALGVQSVFAEDLNGDGDPDVLSASFVDDKVAWYENTDGLGTFGPQQVITSAALGAQSVFAADLDGDTDADVLSASGIDDTIAWYENTDGLGTFGPQQVIHADSDFAASVLAADLDGDTHPDVLSTSYSDDEVAWYENTNGLGAFGDQQSITKIALNSAWSLVATDLNGDSALDVLTASLDDNKIVWYENTDGLGTLGSQQVISTAVDSPFSVFAADLDGDGDADALSASFRDNKIAWYENTDGLGTFGTQQVITTAAEGTSSVVAADLDGDGDIDALSASFRDNKLAWYENTDGLGTFGPQQVIATPAAASIVVAADVDGDGDTDIVLSSGPSQNLIDWYENTDGLATFGPAQMIATGATNTSAIVAKDLDQDSDIDVLVVATNANEIVWFENTDGLGSFGPEQVITTAVSNPLSAFTTDLDGDGDVDVLSASRNKLAWYENSDGLGTFGPQQVVATIDNGLTVVGADMDGDGDSDVLLTETGDQQLVWYQNTGDDCNGNGVPDACEPDADGDGIIDDCEAGCPGDTDGDDDVDLSDLANVLRDFGLNEAGLDGDVNDDGSVNLSDLATVLANFGLIC